MKKLSLFVTFFLLLALHSSASQNIALSRAADAVEMEIARILAGKSEYVGKIGAWSDYDEDFVKFLKKHEELGQPKPLSFEGRVVKILVPFYISSERAGGFFQVSPDGKTIISYPLWDKAFNPLFQVDRKKWEAAADAASLPELLELVPPKDGHSAGVPVAISDLTDVFLIDYVDMLPGKTQEDRAEYSKKVGFKTKRGRRLGTSKCMSLSASIASDWWNIAQGNRIGSYDSFIHGAREYGMNPRTVESLYFNTPKSPYSFIKELGKDLITGEKIPYSPKHYAWIMTSIDIPAQIVDPLKSELRYRTPGNGFGMDLPFMTSFDRGKGDVKSIREDLRRYGIMYAQHTSRLIKDKVPLTFHGVHGVNIIGTAKLKGEPVIIYCETFGHNHRDYMEDEFMGPFVRAFPVKFFYQGVVFPHRIIADLKLMGKTAEITFKTAAGQPIVPENLAVRVNGKVVRIDPSEKIRVPVGGTSAALSIEYSRRYFYTPEEAEGYRRNFLISNGKFIELSRYEAILKTFSERKKMIRGRDSYVDYLRRAAETTAAEIETKLAGVRSDKSLLNRVGVEISKSEILKRSQIGRTVADMLRFNKLSH